MKLISLLILLIAVSCHRDPKAQAQQSTRISTSTSASTSTSIINPQGNSLSTRFNTPKNYKRLTIKDGSFSAYLRSLPLEKDGASVRHYDGSIKSNNNIYAAVVDMPIGSKDLHQCADAIMRLRAEYLWNQERYDDIHFNFTNGFRCDYSTWMQGYRMKVEGNKTEWVKTATSSNEYSDFWSYMELIFMYAGTASLSKELIAIDINAMQIGDVFIKGGHPGHAVLVVDMAYDPATDEQFYMIGQSYMPAQEFQILQNNNETAISPWYRLSDIGHIITPEWTFTQDQLKRFN